MRRYHQCCIMLHLNDLLNQVSGWAGAWNIVVLGHYPVCICGLPRSAVVVSHCRGGTFSYQHLHYSLAISHTIALGILPPAHLQTSVPVTHTTPTAMTTAPLPSHSSNSTTPIVPAMNSNSGPSTATPTSIGQDLNVGHILSPAAEPFPPEDSDKGAILSVCGDVRDPGG